MGWREAQCLSRVEKGRKTSSCPSNHAIQLRAVIDLSEDTSPAQTSPRGKLGVGDIICHVCGLELFSLVGVGVGFVSQHQHPESSLVVVGEDLAKVPFDDMRKEIGRILPRARFDPLRAKMTPQQFSSPVG